MSTKARIKASSIQGCLSYLRGMVVSGATTIHLTKDGIDKYAYKAIIENAVRHARECTRMIMLASERGGLDTAFESVYGKTMNDYLNECLNKVKPPPKRDPSECELDESDTCTWERIHYYENILSCYLGFLTAVEAITTETPYPLSQRATEQ